MPGRESQKIRTSGRAGGSRRPAAIATLLLLLSVGAGHGQWVQSSGPKGTSVRSLGSAGGTLFVGTWDWIFLSGDRGRTWSTDTGVGSAGNILLFQGEYFTGTSIGVKKRAAVEGSRPWTPGGLDNRYVTAMAELGPYLYALTFSGVFRSLDGGVVWDSLPMGVPKGSTTAMSAADGAIFVGTSGNGVYRSLDSGNTWVASEVALPASNVDEIAAGSDVFARTPKGLYRSTDRGGSWKELAVDTGNGHPTAMLLSGADLYVGTSAGWVLRSPDRGNTWTRAQASPSEWPIMHLAVVAADIFAATGTEVFRSSDQGNTWIPVDLLDASIGSFAESGGDLFASSANARIYRSRDNGANWTAVNRGLSTDAAVYDLAVLGGYVVAATSSYIFRSGDRGDSWQQFRTGLPTYPYLTSLFVSGSGLYAGSDVGLYRSLDSGQTWKRAGDSVVAKVWGGPMAEMGRHILLGTDLLRQGTGGIYHSSDGGMTWTRPDSGMPPLRIRALLAKDGYFFAGADQNNVAGDPPIGMYRSADSGATWTRINHGLTNLHISCLITVHGALIVGTRKGAFRSVDNGDTWTPIDDGAIPPILSLTVSGAYLIAGVEHGSTWRMPLIQAVSLHGSRRPRAGISANRRGRPDGGPYDIRGKDASEASSRTWKVWKRQPESR